MKKPIIEKPKVEIKRCKRCGMKEVKYFEICRKCMNEIELTLKHKDE